MNRINQVDPTTSAGKARELFDGVQTKLGMVPNLFRVFGNSPAALKGYLDFSGALAGGVLNAKIREQIALAVAQINSCDYCLSAHSYIGGMVGLDNHEITGARSGSAEDPRTAAILNLARSVVVQHGVITDAELASARVARLTDAEIVETVANVALNVLTNYTNHMAQTVIDFPAVSSADIGVAATT